MESWWVIWKEVDYKKHFFLWNYPDPCKRCETLGPTFSLPVASPDHCANKVISTDFQNTRRGSCWPHWEPLPQCIFIATLRFRLSSLQLAFSPSLSGFQCIYPLCLPFPISLTLTRLISEVWFLPSYSLLRSL